MDEKLIVNYFKSLLSLLLLLGLKVAAEEFGFVAQVLHLGRVERNVVQVPFEGLRSYFFVLQSNWKVKRVSGRLFGNLPSGLKGSFRTCLQEGAELKTVRVKLLPEGL